MNKLFENWRNFRNEVLNEINPAARAMIGDIAKHQDKKPREPRDPKQIAAELGYSADPDSDADDETELANMAGGMTRNMIEKTIEEFSFNSGHPKSSQHRWGRGQPIIDYSRRWDDGSPVYTATDPEGVWEDKVSHKGEDLVAFLTRVKDIPKQQELQLTEPEAGAPAFSAPNPATHRRLRQQTRAQGGYSVRGAWKPRE